MAKAGETQDRCTQYALDVVSGKITAGEYVRLACQRHLDDIEKSKAAPYKYYFDVEKSEEIINFAEELTIAEGEENEHVTAYPFQCFILGSLNGWRTKEKSYRRFRTSYVQLGRQNGKSFINGILACYYGNFDGYKYGKIFCTATKQDQANIVFDEVAKFINSDEDLSEWFKVHDQWSNSLYIKDIASWKACAVLKSLKDFRGSKCYVGVDLSSGGDLTSIAIVIPFMVEDTKKYFVHTHSFIPSSRVDEHIKTDKVPYDVWIEKGLVTVTETLGGIKTDYKYIIRYLEDLVREYNLKPQLICYDPHNASAFLSDLEAMGFDSISVTQTAKELNDATVDFRLEILAGNVEIEGMEVGKEGNKIVVPVDSLLVWSIANAKTISNNYGEIKIDKDITTERIDPIDAIIDAWKHAMKEEYRPDVNETVNEWLEQYEKYMKKGGEK